MPIVCRTIDDARSMLIEARKQGKRIGLVPTMGALHEGHASLMRAACQECDYIVVSIFLNPTQFGPNEDLDRYPRTFEQDMETCKREQVNLVFAPTPAVMYPQGFCTYVEVHGLQNVLCGRTRPTHFRGVTTVVLKLFNIIQPDIAFFGQKDAQQARILQKMVDDLNVPVQMRICPTVREPDGLAMSSRNQYLNGNQRRQATVLFNGLEKARKLIEEGERDVPRLLSIIRDEIATAPEGRLDYAEVVDYQTLEPIQLLRGKALIALAMYIGDTRLIDNLLVDVPSNGVP